MILDLQITASNISKEELAREKQETNKDKGGYRHAFVGMFFFS